MNLGTRITCRKALPQIQAGKAQEIAQAASYFIHFESARGDSEIAKEGGNCPV
jgi:hypothetical protein